MIIFSTFMLKQQQVLHQSSENSHLFEIQVVFIFFHTEIFAFKEAAEFSTRRLILYGIMISTDSLLN